MKDWHIIRESCNNLMEDVAAGGNQASERYASNNSMASQELIVLQHPTAKLQGLTADEALMHDSLQRMR